MWHLTSYHISKGLFSHIVQDECLEAHNEYIKLNYDSEPEWTKEIDEIIIDPGGLMRANGSKSKIIIDDNDLFTINNEHILIAINYYFNIDILSDAIDRIETSREKNEGYTVRFIDDNVLKVYLPYMILVMTPDTYMSIAGAMEKLYLKGVNAYLELVSQLPDEHFEFALGEPFMSDDVAEA